MSCWSLSRRKIAEKQAKIVITSMLTLCPCSRRDNFKNDGEGWNKMHRAGMLAVLQGKGEENKGKKIAELGLFSVAKK